MFMGKARYWFRPKQNASTVSVTKAREWFSPEQNASSVSIACLEFRFCTSPAGSLLAVKLHSENGVIFKGKYEILILPDSSVAGQP